MTVHIVTPQGPSSSFQLCPEEPSNLEWHTHIARVCGQVFLECFDHYIFTAMQTSKSKEIGNGIHRAPVATPFY